MHVDPDLSAYLDGELAPAERVRIEAHLDSCDRCAGRLAELRATASLMAALPYSRASRSLVPSLTQRWTWLRPVRALSMVASGAFLFVFLLTAVARTGLGGAGAPTAAQVAAPASSAAIGAGALGAPTPVAQAVPAPQPSAAQAPAFGPADQGQQRSAAGTAAPSVLLDAQKRVGSASPTVASAPQEGVLRTVYGTPAPNPLLEPLMWLALAIVAAVLAIAAHLRLRTR